MLQVNRVRISKRSTHRLSSLPDLPDDYRHHLHHHNVNTRRAAKPWRHTAGVTHRCTTGVFRPHTTRRLRHQRATHTTQLAIVTLTFTSVSRGPHKGVISDIMVALTGRLSGNVHLVLKLGVSRLNGGPTLTIRGLTHDLVVQLRDGVTIRRDPSAGWDTTAGDLGGAVALMGEVTAPVVPSAGTEAHRHRRNTLGTRNVSLVIVPRNLGNELPH